MRLCNYVIQEDVQRWLSWGIEGEHYYVENGRFIREDEDRAEQTDPQWVRDNMGRWYRDLWPKVDGTFTDGNATGPGGQNEEAWDSLPEYDQNLFTKLGIENRIAYLGDPVQIKAYYPFYSKKTFNNDGSAADLGWVNQAEYMKVSLVQLVTAAEGEFDGLYEEYLAGLAEIDMTATMTQLQADIEYYLSIAEDF
jgi:putative aldouronate transport system substrate-binding protein